jgi:PAS domain S-box-containing protein
VLLVEDSEEDAVLLERELRRGGYRAEVVRVQTPEDMKQALDEQRWDLVVSDYNLPRFSGLDALGVLHQSGQDLPFVIVSGTVGEARAIELMRAGAHDFVMKDQMGRFVPVIDRELREAQHRRERRRAEEALRASEARYRELFENANDLVFTLGLDGRFTSLNRAGEISTGYTPEEAMQLRLVDVVAPENRESIRACLAATDAGSATTFEAVLMGKDGRRIPLEIGWRAIVRNGTVVGFEAIARDMTERHRLEDQLRQAQKMEAVGRLAGGIAHDFNNLLMAVTGYSELLLERLPPDDALRRSAEEIRNAGTRAAALTRQLLTFSRKHVMTPSVLDLNAVVADVERMLRRLIGEDVELTTSLTHGIATVKTDRGQLEQVLVNLVVNARDAMPNGGTLRLSTSRVEVGLRDMTRFPGVPPGNYVLLEVTDTGCGMNAETLAHLFEPFFTTKEPGKGTGLGLSTAYAIVAQSGGHILVDSVLGRGTTFRVLLPETVERPSRPMDAPSRGELPRGTETVLVVEDEPGVRDLIRDFLTRCGYKVVEAGSAMEAIEIVAAGRTPIEMLVTDVVMPQMNGRVLAERLVAAQPSLKVLYMSGYTEDRGLEQNVSSGAAFLQKPFTPDMLARKVREVLDAGSSPSR